MAKSIRSKWKRKCRAIKRERYGAKELERLKKTLGITENGSTDVEMQEINQIATVVSVKNIKESSKPKESNETDSAEKMDTDNTRVYNKRTLKDQYGNYPVWMNRRKILKHKKGRAKSKKGSTKNTGKRLTRREKKASTKK